MNTNNQTDTNDCNGESFHSEHQQGYQSKPAMESKSAETADENYVDVFEFEPAGFMSSSRW